MFDSKYRSRKFILAVVLTIGGIAGLIIDRDLIAYGVLAGTILGAYGWTSNNDPDKKNSA